MPSCRKHIACATGKKGINIYTVISSELIFIRAGPYRKFLILPGAYVGVSHINRNKYSGKTIYRRLTGQFFVGAFAINIKYKYTKNNTYPFTGRVLKGSTYKTEQILKTNLFRFPNRNCFRLAQGII